MKGYSMADQHATDGATIATIFTGIASIITALGALFHSLGVKKEGQCVEERVAKVEGRVDAIETSATERRDNTNRFEDRVTKTLEEERRLRERTEQVVFKKLDDLNEGQTEILEAIASMKGKP